MSTAKISRISLVFGALVCTLRPYGVSAADSKANEVEVTLSVPLVLEARGALNQFDEGLQCRDLRQECGTWAREGECSNNPRFMLETCRVSCNSCQMEPGDAIKIAESALLALRSLTIHFFTANQTAKASQLNEATNAIIRRYSQMVPNPRAYLQNIHRMIVSELQVLPEDTMSTFKTTIIRDNVIPPGKLEDAMYVLSNDVGMPLVGFGTWQLQGEICYKSVLEALKAGYRHVDTAQGYYNEIEVGRAIKDSGIPREDIFVSTKLSIQKDYEAGRVEAALKKQLKELDLDYVDLYMIHGPVHSNPAINDIAWKQIEEIYEKGLAKSIGLSNFGVEHMQRIIANGKIKPMYVQNKMSIYHSNGQYRGNNELEFCKEQNIAFMSYSTLNSWPHMLSPLGDQIASSIAAKHKKTTAQVLLRWALQNGAGVIPRSGNPGRIKENIELFDFFLNEEEMAILNSLNDLIQSPSNLRPRTPSIFGGKIPSLVGEPKDPFFIEEEQTPHESRDPRSLEATFVNPTDDELEVKWVSHEGKREPVGSIGAKEEISLSTFHGHTFEVFKGDVLIKSFEMNGELGREQSFNLGEENHDDL
ncbi:hypothetical protein AAMO2058_001598000 [Amorphochlora amoebiformis]